MIAMRDRLFLYDKKQKEVTMKRIIFLTIFIFFALVSCNKQQTEGTKQQVNNVNLQWSEEKSPDVMYWHKAKQYCENLNEGGYNNWRLPNIDELRTLIKDRKTATGGKCKVSEKRDCLSVENCFTLEDCAEDCYFDDDSIEEWICKGECGEESETRCTGDGDDCITSHKCNYASSDGKYSKLGDTETFLSSSMASPIYGDIKFWTVSFNTGRVTAKTSAHVRCVRNPKDKTSTKSAGSTDKKTSKIGKLYWSEKSSSKMTWDDAISYCRALFEEDLYGWRLPNIDELRTLIKNCPKTETGGECKISEKNNCLYDKCRNSCACEYKEENGGYYSKLGDDDKVWLWSSSTRLDFKNWAWIVGFHYGTIGNDPKDKTKHHVRCVRNAK